MKNETSEDTKKAMEEASTMSKEDVSSAEKQYKVVAEVAGFDKMTEEEKKQTREKVQAHIKARTQEVVKTGFMNTAAEDCPDPVDGPAGGETGSRWKDGAGRCYTKLECGHLKRDGDGKHIGEDYFLLWKWEEIK